MKTIIWLACLYGLLLGSALALPNNADQIEARGKKHKSDPKKHPKHPKHPQPHPHPHPHPQPHPVYSTSTITSTTSATPTTSATSTTPSTVTVGALATATTTVTTTITTSTRSTISAGANFTPIRSQLGSHVFSRRADPQKRDATTVTVTSSTTTVTTTATSVSTAVSTEAPFYGQCGADNFVTSIDGDYIDYLGGTDTTQSAFDTATQDACCASCQSTANCVAFLYRYPYVPSTRRRRSVPSVIYSCTLLIKSTFTCPLSYDAHLVLPANALNVGKAVIGNGNCGNVNVVPLLPPL